MPVVATRPAPNGLGATTERALKEIEEFKAAYLVLPDYEGIWPIWKQIVNPTVLKVFAFMMLILPQ
ncbi:MAG: hypothetical protein F9K48_06600 [Candidatus Brocadia sp.]|nr:MAG: hypothetical protein F9K48_06600 [Candidatus Brocadia sp.]